MRTWWTLAIVVICIVAPIPAGLAADPDTHIIVLVAYYSQGGNTEKMARAVAAGAKSVARTTVTLRRVEKVTADELLGADAVVIGSPVYWGNMAGPVKVFIDDWQLRFGVWPDLRLRDKVGAAFATGGQVSGGKEVTMLTILAAMLGNQMIVVSGGGAFGASATTEGRSPGIDAGELAQAKELGARVAGVAWRLKEGKGR